jgi:RimJ/RimL family protein N-acetyltransferase
MARLNDVRTERLDLRRTDPATGPCAAHQGHGFATELGRAAQAAAGEIDGSVLFIAWIAPHNAPSIKVAERLGLTNHGLRADPSDGQLRLAYADRQLP